MQTHPAVSLRVTVETVTLALAIRVMIIPRTATLKPEALRSKLVVFAFHVLSHHVDHEKNILTSMSNTESLSVFVAVT